MSGENYVILIAKVIFNHSKGKRSPGELGLGYSKANPEPVRPILEIFLEIFLYIMTS